MLSELLHADNLVMMSDTIKGLTNKFIKCKEVFESKGIKLTKVMVNGSITKDDLSTNRVYSCKLESIN